MTNFLILNKLKELEEISSTQKFWNIEPKQGDYLSNCIKELNPKNILEIGTSNGYSTMHLAKNMSNNSKITTIEVDNTRFDIAKKNFEDINLTDKITQIKGEIIDLLVNDKIKGEFDFVFIDAAQKFYSEIFNLLKGNELLTNNATIIFDNVLSHDMNEFIEQMKKKYNCEIIEGLLIVKLHL